MSLLTSSELIQEVTKKLAESGPDLRATVIEHLTAEALSKRKAQIIQAIEKAAALQKEFKDKHKPDQVIYDGDGKVLQEAWSKNALENKKKSKEKLDRIEGLITKCLSEKSEAADFDNLVKLINDGGQNQQQKGGGQKTTTEEKQEA